MNPFLKWAGGKRNLVKAIVSLLPQDATRLVEPFVGSGAVFLAVPKEEYLLGDSNRDLIDLYRILRRDGLDFVALCEQKFEGENGKDRFYDMREKFNALPHGSVERAAIFVFLNRNCFNGLCRYNKSGGYNVPWGQYKKTPGFPRQEMVDFIKAARRAEFVIEDFADVLARTEPGDAVYCDPPYMELSPSASFSAYAKEGFSDKDQMRLALACQDCADRGVRVVVSNHDTPRARELYSRAVLIEVRVRRSISGTASGRGDAGELLAVFGAYPGHREQMQARMDEIMGVRPALPVPTATRVPVLLPSGSTERELSPSTDPLMESVPCA